MDESTEHDYLLAAAWLAGASITKARRTMQGLLMPGQRSLHMRKERKRASHILRAISSLETHVLLFRVQAEVSQLRARRLCLNALASKACQLEVGRLTLDSIDSMVQRDRTWLIEGSRAAGHASPPFTYRHQHRHEEPLLWIPDAVGWAWSRSSVERELIAGLTTVIDL